MGLRSIWFGHGLSLRLLGEFSSLYKGGQGERGCRTNRFDDPGLQRVIRKHPGTDRLRHRFNCLAKTKAHDVWRATPSLIGKLDDPVFDLLWPFNHYVVTFLKLSRWHFSHSLQQVY